MPLLSRPWILAAVAGYLLAVAVVGVWAARRTRSPRDFFIAGQRAGLWVTALATMSAAFSGFVFLGGPGLTYRLGVTSLFILAPVGFTAALLCWVLAGRLRALAAERQVFTIPDALAWRYGGRGAPALGALAVVAGTVGYLGTQLLALAVLLEAVLGTREALGPWSLPAAMAVGLAVVVGYSAAGGMLAGIYTDVVQGALMLVAAVAVFERSIAVVGGWRGMVDGLAASPLFAGFMEPFGRAPVLTALSFYFVFGIGVLGQPHMLHKFFMLRDPRRLRWMPLVLGGSQAVCLLVWLGLGLAVPALVAAGRLAPLARPDDAAVVFLLEFAPEALAALAVAAVLAAVMSTADSFLNIASAALVRDLPRLLGRPLANELAWGRLATVAVALAAAALALGFGDLIALLGTLAFGTFAAALAPALAIGFNSARITSRAAAASIATGLALSLGLELLRRQPGWDASPPFAAGALPSALALAASLAVLFLVSWWDGTGGRGARSEVEELLAAGVRGPAAAGGRRESPAGWPGAPE